MSETALLLWLQAVGLTLLLPLVRISFALRCFLALPIGTAAYVMAVWLSAILGLSFSFWIVAVAVSGVAAVTYIRSRPSLVDVGSLHLAALFVAFGSTALISFATQHFHLAKMSADSVRMIEMTGGITQGIPLADLPTILARPLFLPLAHTPAIALTGDFYVEALTPALGLAMVFGFAGLANEILKERAVAMTRGRFLAAAATLAALSGYLVVFQLVYVNTHLAFAFFLALLVTSSWLAAVKKEPQWMVLAIPAVASLALLRLEGPIVAVLALAPILVVDRIPFRMRALLTGAFAVVVFATFGSYLSIGRQGLILGDSSILGTLLLVAGTVLLLVLTRWARALPLVRNTPWLLLGSLWLIAVVTTLLRPEPMTESASVMFENLSRSGQWGATWIGLPVLVLIATLIFRVPFPALWAVPVLGFVPLTYAMSYFRDPFRVGWGDSGNRMMTHILLVAVLYVMLGATEPKPTESSRREGRGSQAPKDSELVD